MNARDRKGNETGKMHRPTKKGKKRRALLSVVFVIAMARIARAQTPVPALPTSVDVLVLPGGTSDPLTTVMLASRNTLLPGTVCNRAASPPPPLPLINPRFVEINDEFNVGRVCQLPLPIGLPNGSGYRTVAIFNSTCDTATGPAPCSGPQSAVGAPFFDITAIRGRPVAPTALAVKP